MNPTAIDLPEPGSVVHLRHRTWRVENVVFQEGHGGNPLVELACFDDDAQGETLTVLWGVERKPLILDGNVWKDIGQKGFDEAGLFSAFMHTMRWNCVTATDPRLYQAPFRAGIRLDAYQLEPLDKALQMPRVNLFIADDVGLGKTIEAGLIASEMILRRRVKEVCVAAPPNMLIQWQEEMENRFGLRFEILDRSYIERMRQERGYGVNPWTTFPRFLISHKLLIDEAYAAPLRDWLGSIKTNSLLVLDEAHHAAPASGAKYAIDSRFTRAIRDIAPRFEHRLFLSATPHNGHSNSFSALLEILDPLRFTRGVKVVPKHVEDAIIRRLKDDIRKIDGGGFPERVVEPVILDGLSEDQAELRLGALLDEYRRIRAATMAKASTKQRNQFQLLISGLQQRLFSSVAAFHRTILVHARTMEKIWANETTAREGEVDLSALQGSFADDDEGAGLEAEDQWALEAEAIAAATEGSGVGTVGDSRRERELLEEMTRVAERDRDKEDARVVYLLAWIERNLKSGSSWNETRLLIFTEYEDTRRYLMRSLRNRLGEDELGRRVEFYSGLTSEKERERIKQDFNADPKAHPLRILIATDAAREGLNLQSWCHDLFHFDIPWNPSRLEQRNGRIDRKLQRAAKVYCRYFVYAQRPEDRILGTLVRKTEVIHRELGSLAQVLDSRMAKLLKEGIQRESLESLAKEISDTDMDAEGKALSREELEESCRRHDKLSSEIATLQGRLDYARKKMGMDERHLRDSIDSSLRLMNIGGMERLGEGPEGREFRFPDLARQRGADPSWESTLKSLRPRGDGRAEGATTQDAALELKPVVFSAPEQNDDSLVQLHLEHKLVKRLLSRFLSQGFLHHDLSRACLVQAKDSVPRVALLGRLSVYGAGATRLHEEIVSVTARWIDPARRGQGWLEVYGAETEEKTLEQLEEALTPEGQARRPTRNQEEGCRAALERDVAELVPLLGAAAEKALEKARRLLVERGRKESASLKGLLEEQRKRVLKQREEDDLRGGQMLLGFSEEEVRQYRENRRYWEHWLKDAALKLESEPERIIAFYTPVSWRVEPIGIAYLMPAGSQD